MEKASVQLSTKSWHYKLIKWTLGNNAPTPWNMHNLCPYFWLLIFSILVQPIFAPFKLIWLGLNTLSVLMEKAIDVSTSSSALNWFDKLTDTEAYFLWEQWSGYYNYKDNDIKIPYNFKSVKKMSVKQLLEKWLLEKKGINMFTKDSTLYNQQTTPEYTTWRKEMEASVSEKRKITMTKVKVSKPTSKVTIVGRQIGDAIDNFFKKVVNAFSGWKEIIKWTKRFVGLGITAGGLFGTFFIVQFMGRGILYVLQNWDWRVFWILLLIIGLAVMITLLIWAIGKLADYIKYKVYDLWWVKAIYYSLVLPLKWIFIDFLWKIIIVAIFAKFLCVTIIWGGTKLIWKGIFGFLGIFGEYFGASYGDYCPGIEWEENE